MKVLLLHSPSKKRITKEDRCQNDLSDFTIEVPRPPINMMYLGAISKRLGHETILLDAPIEGVSYNQCLKLLDMGFDYVVSSLSLQTMEDDLAILKRSKENGTTTIAYGYASTIQDVEILEKNPFVDIIIRGEPEITFEEILKSTPLEEIKGITFRDNDRIIKNDSRGFNNDLDSFPFPSRDLIKNELYVDPVTGRPFTTIQASRGCKFQCTFCLSRLVNGRKVRYRSIGNVIEEIKTCINDFGITDFFFRGDTFTVNKKWVIGLCEEIKKEGLDITWYCNSRVDTIDSEMLEAMKAAGCKLITFGIESGNEEILKSIKKGITKQQALNAIRLTREAGILAWAFYVLGLPGDTRETIDETIKFSKEVDSDFVEYHHFIPFPGTDAYEQEPCKVEEADLVKLINRAYMGYYLRPKIIIRNINTFFLHADSIPGLIRLGKTGGIVLKRLLKRLVT